MSDGLSSVLPSVVVLGAAAVIALLLTLARGNAAGNAKQLRATARLAVVALLLQALHFTEELATGFHRRFPEVLGLEAMSLPFFVGFNFIWLVAWGLSVWGLTRRVWAALFPLWFLGLGCALNGIAHPSLSLATGGYFPGLVTSPLSGLAGVLLLWRLFGITGAEARPHAGATTHG